jgi:hypothetical protein
MLNNSRILLSVSILVSCCSFSCASLKSKNFTATPILNNEPIELKLKSLPGRKENTLFYSNAKVKTYESQQLIREKDEIVEFEVESQSIITEGDPDQIRTLLSTIKKDGQVDLHDLAFPEIKERIEFVFKPNAEVIYAGNYPKSSVFFIPPLSLPNEKVKVGDTWEMQRSWVSMKNNIPLKLHMVTILKNLYSCGNQGVCADLEVSGVIDIIAAFNNDTKFGSQISGRLIFSLNTGSILWSLVKSTEEISIADSKMEVKSCLISRLLTPKEEVWGEIEKPFVCTPNEITSIEVPGT